MSSFIGDGKSNLLLNLIDRRHLWVADDLVLFYLNERNTLIGHAANELSPFIHVKGLGPINMDQTYGQSCRIASHSLAAVIHLSDNSHNENMNLSAFNQQDSLLLHNTRIPMWQMSKSNANLPCMVENCAKSLILNNWGYSASSGLENALNNMLSVNNSNA